MNGSGGPAGSSLPACPGLARARAPFCCCRSLAATWAADSGFGPLRQLQGREQAVALLDAIAQLPVEQRDAFLLQAEAGMSVQEIAATTQVTFETAKSRLRYARQTLRRLLQEYA